jgi:hypothetical protein
MKIWMSLLLAQLSSKTPTNKKNREPQFFLGH